MCICGNYLSPKKRKAINVIYYMAQLFHTQDEDMWAVVVEVVFSQTPVLLPSTVPGEYPGFTKILNFSFPRLVFFLCISRTVPAWFIQQNDTELWAV